MGKESIMKSIFLNLQGKVAVDTALNILSCNVFPDNEKREIYHLEIGLVRIVAKKIENKLCASEISCPNCAAMEIAPSAGKSCGTFQTLSNHRRIWQSVPSKCSFRQRRMDFTQNWH